MFISARRKRLAFSRLLEPQALLDALSDMNQGYAWDWLGLKQSPGVFFADRKDQFKIFSITEGVIQVTAQAATCDAEAEFAACHLTRQDWGVPVRVTPDGARRLSLVLRG